MVAVPSAQAHNVAGASGGCDDDEDASEYTLGNQFEDEEADVGVNASTNPNETDPPDAVDAAQAIGNLAEGFAGDGNPPSNACDGEGSWLAVYAAGSIVVCYDGGAQTDTTVDGQYTFGGECSHHDGAGNNNGDLVGDQDYTRDDETNDCFAPTICLDPGDL